MAQATGQVLRYEGSEPVRVNKWLAQSGICSRREAEALIAQGRIWIEGAVVQDAGRKLEPGQTLELRGADGALAAALEIPPTVLIHKPPGVVSAHPVDGQTEARALLVPARRMGPEVAGAAPDAALPPLGRLDRDSRGLLILSADGVLAKALIGPASQVEKEYEVIVSGAVTPGKLDRLRFGLVLDGRALQPAQVEQVAEWGLRFTLREGRNRQIRRMCRMVGLHVDDLKRVRIGPLRLGALPEGSWRGLTAQEREQMISSGA
jgi:23S rRNA pseudouridine2604 synthase